MRHIEKFAVLLAVFYFISLLGGYPLSLLLSNRFSPAWHGEYNISISIISTLQTILQRSLNIAIGIWLLIDAKKNGSKRWVWLLFGLFYGVLALILYFVYKLHQKDKNVQK